MNTVLEQDVVSEWIARLLISDTASPSQQLALMQLARKTGDRYRDISVPLREKVIQRFVDWNAPASYRELVECGGGLSSEQQESVFGESLPLGLQIAFTQK